MPHALRRQLRAAAHNLRQGKPLRDGETADRLMGYAAYVYPTDRRLGAELLGALGTGG